jgi:hypothetical protein
MPKTSRKTRTADDIAEMVSRGEDISTYLTNKFMAVRSVRRVNLDLTRGMLLLGRALNEERENKPRSKKPLAARHSGK